MTYCDECDGRGWRWRAVLRTSTYDGDDAKPQPIAREKIMCLKCRGHGAYGEEQSR